MTLDLKLWHRNLIGGAVSAVALAVIVVTMLLPDWSGYRDTMHTETVVPVGETGAAAGDSWRVGSVRHLNRSASARSPGLPEGTVITVVAIDRAGTADLVGCAGVITDGQHRWFAESIGGYGPLPPEGATGNCARPGPLQFSFLLPGDVVPTAVDVTDLQGRLVVRLLV
ncbi:MAG: hypothetical protein WBB07_29390 [Mycobacterium sp.]